MRPVSYRKSLAAADLRFRPFLGYPRLLRSYDPIQCPKPWTPVDSGYVMHELSMGQNCRQPGNRRTNDLQLGPPDEDMPYGTTERHPEGEETAPTVESFRPSVLFLLLPDAFPLFHTAYLHPGDPIADHSSDGYPVVGNSDPC